MNAAPIDPAGCETKVPADTDPQRFGEHRNNFGFLRLLFASLVIVSHTPELIDGDRGREPLTRLFGTISFGELAVEGFFVISGYLILGSYLKDPRPSAYLLKRVARIYPGFLVASLVCLLIVAPLAGGSGAGLLATAAKSVVRMLLLERPNAPGNFAGSHYTDLNGAMWTIGIEFRCYLLVLALGLAGVFRRPWLVPVIAVAALAAYAFTPLAGWRAVDGLPHGHLWRDSLAETVRLAGVFLVGSTFYLWRRRIGFSAAGCAVAVTALCACLFVPRLAHPGFALFGGYLIFAFAGWDRSGLFQRINNRDDISYGVYLYAWPVEKLLILYGSTALIATGAATFAAACALGWLSWHLVEKPVMRRVRNLRR